MNKGSLILVVTWDDGDIETRFEHLGVVAESSAKLGFAYGLMQNAASNAMRTAEGQAPEYFV